MVPCLPYLHYGRPSLGRLENYYTALSRLSTSLYYLLHLLFLLCNVCSLRSMRHLQRAPGAHHRGGQQRVSVYPRAAAGGLPGGWTSRFAALADAWFQACYGIGCCLILYRAG